MNRWLQFLCVTMLLGSMAGVAGADERILAFDSVIRIAADGSLDVTETITVRAEGSQIRRGIYRDFPTRYRDAHGFRHSVDFEMVSLRRDDITEPWFTETLGNGVRINFGNDNFLPVPGEFRYELRYRTRRQLGYFESHDELYWNVTGNDWDFVIDRASARVELPQPIAPASLRLDAYTGPTGSRENWTRVEAAAGVATWTLRGSLDPGSGMTVVLGFPKGLVPEPSAGVRLGWWLRDFTGPIASFGILFAMLAFYYRLWNRIGRDPAAGTIIVRYDPPREHSPAGLRYLKRYAYDPVCFSADAVALAVAGTLRIEHEKGGFLGKDAWSLHSREAPVPDEVPLGDSRRSLMATLFSGTRRVVELEASNRSHLMAARAAHEAGLKRKYEPRYFKNNSGWVVVGILGSIVGAGLGVVLSRGNEASILLSLLGGALMLVTSIVFAFLLRRPHRGRTQGAGLHRRPAALPECCGTRRTGAAGLARTATRCRALPAAAAVRAGAGCGSGVDPAFHRHGGPGCGGGGCAFGRLGGGKRLRRQQLHRHGQFAWPIVQQPDRLVQHAARQQFRRWRRGIIRWRRWWWRWRRSLRCASSPRRADPAAAPTPQRRDISLCHGDPDPAQRLRLLRVAGQRWRGHAQGTGAVRA
jgi:hypothetical protein